MSHAPTFCTATLPIFGGPDDPYDAECRLEAGHAGRHRDTGDLGTHEQGQWQSHHRYTLEWDDESPCSDELCAGEPHREGSA